MKKINHGITILLLTLFSLCSLNGRAADADEERIVSLSIVDGLSGETVHRVMTDHIGTTWVATNSGINVFNGKAVHGFRITDEQGRFLAVDDLCEVADQYIYAATEGGLYRMEYRRTGFERILPEVKRPVSLLAVGHTLYIGSEQGLMAYDGSKLKQVNVSPSGHGLDNIVRQYAAGSDGLIWFLSRFDLNSYDPQTGKIRRYELGWGDGQYALTQFAPVDSQLYIIGTRDRGLYLFDIKRRQSYPVAGIGNVVISVQRAADGSICVATDGAGAYRIKVSRQEVGKEPKAEVLEHFSTEADARHRLPSNGVYSYYRDANGINWFGFVRYGLAYTYYCGNLFKVIATGDFTTEGINVRSFCRHGDDVILGTQNGFYHVNAVTGSNRYYGAAYLDGAHIVNAVVWYEGKFYIGTYDGGLKVFDPQTQTIGRTSFSPLLDRTSVGDLKIGPDGRLWIGSANGLMIVGDGQLQQHFTEQNSRIVGGMILSITFDGSGNAWLTGAGGCSLYSVRSRGIVETSYPKGFFNTMPWMIGTSGHDGLVFMRTGPQTFYTNEQMTDFGELKLPVAFYDKWCRDMVDDMNGHYLIASERGVFRFDYALKEVEHFGYGEGLRGMYINDMSMDDNGCLWVATSQGLFCADTLDIASWKRDTLYKIHLFNIRRDGILLSQSDGYTVNSERRIRLQWNMTSDLLEAEPILLDYTRQDDRMYEYRLDDDDWQLVPDDQSVIVRGLCLGNHQLEVRLAGATGTTAVYTVTVVPSVWAIVELVLFVIALVLLWLWWRWRKTTKVLLSERDEIEDALVEMEQKLQKEEEKDEPKYERVKIDERECADIVSRMEKYLEREKVFTDADLKMKDLADVLRLSAPKLSQVFNIYLGQNYYDYINRYRLNEFKRLIEAGEYKRFTITALSEQCGFKKSNFFSTFRKVEGMTPTEYLKKKGIKL